MRALIIWGRVCVVAVALVLFGGRAHAANIVVPAGVSGTMTVEFTFTEADFVNAFGTVTRSGGGTPTYRELLNTSTTRIGKRIATFAVTPGQVIEFYLEANTAALPGFTHAFYSSDPTRNTGIDAATPEHILQPQQTADQAAKNIWVLRWEDKNTADPRYDADFNDVVVAVRIGGDRDADGLWDDWEESGIDMDYDGTVDLPLNAPPFNANPNEKDLYVELDWMVAADHTHAPLLDAACNFAADPTSAACSNSVVPRLIQAFAAAPTPVHLHVDTGAGTPFDLSDGNPLGGGEQITEIDGILRPQDSPIAGADNDFDDVKADHFDSTSARRFVFHYGLLGHKMQSCASFSGGVCVTANAAGCSTGNSEAEGNDFLVVLSSACNASNADPAVLFPKQTGTIMHEFGHNLGLGHGGRPMGAWSNDNYKPNYFSVMNYSFQSSGVGTALTPGGAYIGGRFDYSRAVLGALNETSLAEGSGVSGLWDPALRTKFNCAGGGALMTPVASGSIDWNCNTTIDGAAVATDVNQDASQTTLDSSDDWGSLVYAFQNGGSFADGEHDRTMPDPVEIVDSPSLVVVPIPSVEQCDGFDNDGDHLVDEGFDMDGDGRPDCVDTCASQPFGTTPTLTPPPAASPPACAVPFSATGVGKPTTNSCRTPTGRIVLVNGASTNIPLTSSTVLSAGQSTIEWSVTDEAGRSRSAQSTVTLSGATLTATLATTATVTLGAQTSYVIPSTLEVQGNPLWLPFDGTLEFTSSSGTFQCFYNTVPFGPPWLYRKDRLNFFACTNGARAGTLATARTVKLTAKPAFGTVPITAPTFIARLGCQ